MNKLSCRNTFSCENGKTDEKEEGKKEKIDNTYKTKNLKIGQK